MDLLRLYRNPPKTFLRNLFLCSSLSVILAQCDPSSENTTQFELESDFVKSVIVLDKYIADNSTDFSGSTLTNFPLEERDADTSYLSGKFYLTYQIRRPAYGRMAWSQHKQIVFLLPGDTLEIS